MVGVTNDNELQDVFDVQKFIFYRCFYMATACMILTKDGCVHQYCNQFLIEKYRLHLLLILRCVGWIVCNLKLFVNALTNFNDMRKRGLKLQ